MPPPTDPGREPSRPAEPSPAGERAVAAEAAFALGAAAPPDGGLGEPAAWAALQARWDDPAAHRAYLDRFPDLDGLATAGRRYRDALADRPGDPVALGMKAEVLKRATVVGLASLPRTPPPSPTTGRWKRVALLILAAWLASSLAWLLFKLFSGPLP